MLMCGEENVMTASIDDNHIYAIFCELKDRLIVSCQAQADEPLRDTHVMGRMAYAAKVGGAAAIRAESVDDIREIKKTTGLPIIGLIKRDYDDSDIYITPTMREVDELIETPCEIIALDMTKRERPHGEDAASLVAHVHEAGRLVLADISTYDEGVAAEALGADAVSTTLAGYTPYSTQQDEPDVSLVGQLAAALKVPVFAEGRISSDANAQRMMAVGAWAVIIGSAITRPQLITKKFAEAVARGVKCTSGGDK